MDRTARNNSLFEERVRTLTPPACQAFLHDGTIRPVAFSPAGNLGTDPNIRSSFSHLSAETLQANGPAPASTRKLRVAALFSGGPAAGGHNVIAGLAHVLQGHTLLGVRNGPGGLLKGDLFEINDADIAHAMNTGGFDLLGTDRTKIKRPEQLALVASIIAEHRLDAIVIIGGDDSNTNAAIIAEYLAKEGVTCSIISVPKTMDGDVQVADLLPCPFGYDTACRIYAELVGNILQDTPSSHKYWHFIKLMGRTASQVVLEVALQTQPPIALISEEVQARQQSLRDIIDSIAKTVIDRASRGMHYGVVVVPEGLLEFVPEVQALIEEIDEFFGREEEQILAMEIKARRRYFEDHLRTKALFESLPDYIEDMLIADRDAHGNLQVAQIPTERLLAEMVKTRVKELAPNEKFSIQTHSFGYEGRCGVPTLFDATFCYNLGLTAGSLVLAGKTGYMAAFTDLTTGGIPLGLPLKSLLSEEEREGKKEYVIKKALVRLDAPAFKFFAQHRDAWAKEDCFNSPGPRQLWGPTANQLPKTVVLNQGYKSEQFDI